MFIGVVKEEEEKKGCLTGSLNTQDMGHWDSFQGSELLVTEEKVYFVPFFKKEFICLNLILHVL